MAKFRTSTLSIPSLNMVYVASDAELGPNCSFKHAIGASAHSKATTGSSSYSQTGLTRNGGISFSIYHEFPSPVLTKSYVRIS
jgi:hypothetical protein